MVQVSSFAGADSSRYFRAFSGSMASSIILGKSTSARARLMALSHSRADIPAARLQAAPEAARCIDCQGKLEHQRQAAA